MEDGSKNRFVVSNKRMGPHKSTLSSARGASGPNPSPRVPGRSGRCPPGGSTASGRLPWRCVLGALSPERSVAGTSPSYAPTERLLSKQWGSSKVSTKVSAVIGPMPSTSRKSSVSG
jgi:hypothetical protein